MKSLSRADEFGAMMALVLPRQGAAAPWWAAANARLAHLRMLPAGWDGYHGRPLDAAMAAFALEVLEAVCVPTTPVPSLVPGSAGDLQIEWHTNLWDLELDLAFPHSIVAWRRNAVTSAEEELTITNAFAEVRGWVGALGEPAIAPHTATA